MLNLIALDMISCWYIIWYDDIYPLIVDSVIIIYFNTRWWWRWRELFMIIPRHLSDLVCEIKYRNHENLTSRFYIELVMMSAFSYWYPQTATSTPALHTFCIAQSLSNRELLWLLLIFRVSPEGCWLGYAFLHCKWWIHGGNPKNLQRWSLPFWSIPNWRWISGWRDSWRWPLWHQNSWIYLVAVAV